MTEETESRPAPTGIYCPICEEDLGKDYDGEFAINYPGLVCRACDGRSLNGEDQPARAEGIGTYGEDGDNPIFIDSVKCWRRYRFGGWVTMMDPYDCETLEQFYEHQNSD